MNRFQSRLLHLPLAFLGGILAGCPLSPPTVGGAPITCEHSNQCLAGERCDLQYGICVGLGDGGIIGEDGGLRDGGPCKTSICFDGITLSPAATDVGGALYAGANQPLQIFAELSFAGTITSAPAPAALDLGVSVQGADAGSLTMTWADGGSTGYLYAATWHTAGVADLPFTFVASLSADAGTIASDPVVVTVDNTAPTLEISLAGLVDGGPPLPRNFYELATLVGDDHGGSGVDTATYVLAGTGVPSTSTASWPVSSTGTASVDARLLLLDTGDGGFEGTFALSGQVNDGVGNKSSLATLSVPVTRFKWALKLAASKAIDSSPVLGVRGRIYVGGNDQALHAVSPQGTLLWEYPTADRITATPAVNVVLPADGTEVVYVPSQDANVHAIVGVDGGLLTGWTMLSAQGGATAPNVPSPFVNSAAISRAEGSLVAADNGGHVFSMGLGLGNVSGSYPQVSTTPTLQGASAVSLARAQAPPQLAIVVGGDKNLYRFTDVGLALQPSPVALANSDSINANQLGGPALDDFDAWLGAASGIHHFTNLLSAPADSEILPSTGYFVAAVVDQIGKAYVSRLDGVLVGLTNSGINASLGSGITAPPTIGADGNIYVATMDGRLVSLRADGSLAWEGALTNVAINSAPMIDPCNQTLYIGSSDGYLFAVLTDSNGLDPGSWPHFRHDYQGTGNASNVGAVDCANHL